MVKNFLIPLLMLSLLLCGTVRAAETTVSFQLEPYIGSITVSEENPDSDPMLMADGHLDSAWQSKPGSGFPQTITVDFDGRWAEVVRIALSCVNAADEGVVNIDADYRDAEGQWQPLRRNIGLNAQTGKGSQMIEVAQMESHPTWTDAIRIRVNDALTPNGSFNIGEIQLWASAVKYPDGEAEPVAIAARRGEIVVLPDTVLWKTGDREINAPVSWEKKTIFCEETGVLEMQGILGEEETVQAFITVSEDAVLPALSGHWSQTAAEKLQLWEVYDEEDSGIMPDEAAQRQDIAKWFYRGLSISHEYLPERVTLTQSSILPDTDAAEPNELAALGILPADTAFEPEGTMTRMEMAKLCRKALEFEKDHAQLETESLNFTDALTEEEEETLKILAKAGIISNEGAFRPGDQATNAEVLTMLSRLISAASAVCVYPVPEDENVPKMPDYTVKVNGQEAGTYLAHGYPGAGGVQEKTIYGRPAAEVGVSYFDFFGQAEIEITVNNTEMGDASNVVIRPLSLGIKPEVSGNTIRFTLYQPCNLSIEPWGIRRPLQLFANPIEKNRPDFEAENVYYYGPGVHYIDPLVLKDNDIVYVDGGAVVYTKPQEEYTDGGVYYGYSIQSIEPTFSARKDNTGPDDKIKNVTIRGRGVISGSHSFSFLQRHQLLRIYGCQDASVDGVILLEGSAWNVFVAQSDGVYINNLKIVGYYANNDGIDFCDSINGIVENSFSHNADDSFLIKSWAAVDNVHFRNCAVWNTVSTSFGAVCEVIQPITNVSYTDCTVLHSTNPRWTEICGGVIGIWNNGAADIDNVRFENIVIEDAVADKEPIKINVYPTLAEGPKEYAEVKNVVFKNISILEGRDASIALTTSYEEGIYDITFENVTINGEKVTELDDRFTLQNAVDIEIKP